MAASHQPLAVITGASSGIGLELARLCAVEGFELVIASNEDELGEVEQELARTGVAVRSVRTDLSTIEGVETLHAAVGGRPVDVLVANAGTALGQAFLDEDPERIRFMIDTNVSGTVQLVHRIGNGMRTAGAGRILLTGSIAGYAPGSFMAVYNATKAFVNSFAFALRDELKDTGVSVTVLMPGITDTAIFDHADMEDTAVGRAPKVDPAVVARAGFEAMMAGRADIAPGLSNKVMTAVANVVPSPLLAAAHRRVAEPDGDER